MKITRTSVEVKIYDPPNTLFLRVEDHPLGRGYVERVLREVIVAGRGGDPNTARFTWGNDGFVTIRWDAPT